jgi:glycosyltransferase involved in cell wall biosynthesis
VPDNGSVSGLIRIVFVVDNLGIGGSELNAVRTAERIDRDRFSLRVHCLGARGELAERYERLGIPVTCVQSGSLLKPRALRLGFAFARACREERTHIVHAHDVYSNEFAALWTRVGRQGRVIVSRRWLRAPGVHQALNVGTYQLADRVLVNSSAVADQMRATEHVREPRLTVLPNFVDDAAFNPMGADERLAWRARYGLTPSDIVVGVVARLAPVKDHASLLRAVAMLAPRWPELKVLLVGDGPEREPLLKIARELRIEDRVQITGMLSNDPSPHHLLDISVLPSIREGFPNSVVEAMAAGRPVVATNVGGTPDAVIDERTGLLTPPSDSIALAARLERLLSNPDERTRLAASARTWAWERYRAGSVLASLTSLYETLASRPRGA